VCARGAPYTSGRVSTFSLSEFYQRNRRFVIWAILFGLLWLLRDFFALVFLTFVIANLAAPLADFGTQRLRAPHVLALTIVYLLFLAVLLSLMRFVAPSVGAELNRMVSNLPTTEQRLIEIKNGVIERYPTLREPLTGFLRSALSEDRAAVIDEQLAGERGRLDLSEAAIADAAGSLTPPAGALAEYFNRQDRLYLNALLSEQFQALRHYAPAIVNALYRAIATMALALLFSYLILIDQARIKRGVMRLKTSRVGDFYEEAAPPIVRFGVLLGRAIEAQAAIAVLNTLFTLIGLLLLRIPLTAMLSAVVFVCSFVPVLGVLISTIPIVLVALNAGGFGLSLAAIALVAIVHAVEAYLLNPLIYGKHLKLNPVLTLIILYVGYHAFGFWGLLLGVPLARYFIHDVLGVPFRDRRAPKERATAQAPVE
jgi:predicted PurR-regulated permease PerM